MRISGLASGFDTESIIADLMRAERVPLDRIFQQKTRTEWQRDEYRTLNTKIAAFRNTVFDLQLQGNFNLKQALSSNEDILSVKATNSSQLGTYNIKVKELASAANLITTDGVKGRLENFTANITEPITISIRSAKDDSKFVDVTLEANDTIDSFVQKINQNKELGINAFYDSQTDQLVFTSINTGKNALIEFDVTDIDTQSFVTGVLQNETGNFFKNQGGSNARLEINGLETYRESNTFDLAGTEINLKTVSTESVQVKVTQDTDAIFDRIKNFVEQYNDLVEEINQKLNEPFHRDFPPLTKEQRQDMSDKDIELWEEKARSGLLRSDKLLSDIVYSMRNSLTSGVEGLEKYSGLHQIGITTGSWFENGKLHINETKLRTAIEENPEEVASLFSHNPTDGSDNKTGVARRLNSALMAGLDKLSNTAGKSTSAYDQSTLSEKIRGYDDQITIMEERLARVESRYWMQFSSMERLLQEMYAQSDWLYQQLAMMTQ